MSSGLLVTGTDTGVGKTLVSCALLRALWLREHRLGVYKPAETGVPLDADGLLRGEDCVRLLAAAGTEQSLGRVCQALFPIPAAPMVSAEAEGRAIDPAALVRGYEALVPDFDAIWVEGAGGLLVPIAEGFTYADLAKALSLPVIVVVGSKLGCINHALLTLSELDRQGIETVGYVLNECEPESDAAHAVASNRQTLSRFSSHADLGLLPWIDPEERDDAQRLAAHAATHLDLDAVEKALGLSPPSR